jgi:hypothetical protein
VNVEARLRALSDEMERLATEIRILDEQIAFQNEVADDARLRAIVSETPLADREATEATGDLARMQRIRAELDARVKDLRSEQDQLLEKMIEDGR